MVHYSLHCLVFVGRVFGATHLFLAFFLAPVFASVLGSPELLVVLFVVLPPALGAVHVHFSSLILMILAVEQVLYDRFIQIIQVITYDETLKVIRVTMIVLIYKPFLIFSI